MGKSKKKVLLCGFISESHLSEYYYSLGLGYLKAYAESRDIVRNNFDIHIVDFAPDEKNHLEIIKSHNADVVGLSCFLWSAKIIPEIIRGLCGARPETTIIVGGATNNLDEYVASFPDGVLLCDSYQEGEGVFLDFLLAYLKGGGYPGIAGLRAVKGGRVAKGIQRPAVENLDEIPCPYEAKAVNVQPGARRFILEAGRGCPHSCSFCMYSGRREKMRYFSLERVAGQLVWALEHGVEVVDLLVSAVNYDTRRFEALCALIREVNAEGKLKFSYCMHPAHVTPAQIAALNGILDMTESIVAGVQSLSAAAELTMRRKFKPGRILGGLKMLSDVFPVNVDMIAGLPGETVDSLKHSVRELLPYPVHLSIHHLSVLPGTRYHRLKKEYNLEHKGGGEAFRAVSCDTFSSRDYEEIRPFFEELSGSGEFEKSNLLSLHFEDRFSLERGGAEPGGAPRGLSRAERGVDPALLKPLDPYLREGAVFEGWTVSGSLAEGASIRLALRKGDREAGLMLREIRGDEPHLARTAHFYIIYKYPTPLPGDMRGWLDNFVAALTKADRADV